MDIGNALAAFIGTEWQSYDSPFNAYLAGDTRVLSVSEKQGMAPFLEKQDVLSVIQDNC